MRDQRDEESLREREFVKDILVVWRKLKEARSRQNYRNTSVRLVIRKGTMNLSLEQEQWDKELQRELEDAREEHEKNLEEESRAYEKRLNEWKELMSKWDFRINTHNLLHEYDFNYKAHQNWGLDMRSVRCSSFHLQHKTYWSVILIVMTIN